LKQSSFGRFLLIDSPKENPTDFIFQYFIFPADDKTATDKISKNISGGLIIRGKFLFQRIL